MTDLLAHTRPSDQLAPDGALDAVIDHAIELGTDQPDVKAVAGTLVGFAQTDYELLRSARSELLDRLHQRSDNLDATRGLRVLEEALRMLRYPAGG